MWTLLNNIKTALTDIPELKTVKIGAESGISAMDTPAARIITEYSIPGKNPYFDQGSLQVVLLMDLKNDLETVYQQSIELELLIREALKTIVEFQRIDYDQDSVTVFKASILRFTFTGVRNSSEECGL